MRGGPPIVPITSRAMVPGLSLPSLVTAALVAVASLASLGGCAELRGRKKIQDGNAAYKVGDFTLAIVRFNEAAAFVPEMPLLWLNRGYACREMIVPGAPATRNRPAALCALESFKRLRELAPDDPRGDRLYVQTLLDVGEYRTIERTFSLRHERNPNDLDVVLVMEQVFSKMGRWREALNFYRKAAALRPQDAEAQYAVGTFVWQTLQARGGGAPFAEYDPRPRPDRLPSPRPASGRDDIVGSERLALAREGIRYLDRALELRHRYPEALTYMGLLYRQESFALFDDADAWQRAVSQAVGCAARAAEKP
jgi:tetratricopeptide (TPR) repeat protein